MSDKPENPPVIPSPGNDGFWEHRGLTMRDYFAAKAMQAIIAKTPLEPVESEKQRGYIPGLIAVGAYDYADAMLKQRNATTNESN